MTIYEELIERVSNGETFHIDFEKRNMKVGNEFLVKDGEYDKNKTLINLEDYIGDCGDEFEYIMKAIYGLYLSYKFSLPSERSDNKRKKYFKALSMDDIPDWMLFNAKRREVAQAELEGFILCMIILGKFFWKEERLGKWFWQSKGDSDLVILRKWIEKGE